MSHFLFGMLWGAVIAAVVLVFRRRWAYWAPPFILACGFWAEMPYLLGFAGATHWLSNVFFGYGWLHPVLKGRESTGFFAFLALVNLLVVGYVVFLTWCFWTVDTVRWEQGKWRGSGRRRSKRRRSSSRRHREKEQ